MPLLSPKINPKDVEKQNKVGMLTVFRGFSGGSAVKNPPVQKAQIQLLGWEDPLEKKMATHSNILPGKFHEQRSLAGYSPWGREESDPT